jgi:hypothetical protein
LIDPSREGQWVRRDAADGPEWVWCGTTPPDAYSWRRVVLLIATGVILMSLIPTAIVAYAWRHQAQERIADNQAAIKEQAALRNRSDWVAYDACVAGENRDAALVTALTRLIEPSARPQAIIDLIDALEPANEPDCPIPPGQRPDDLPRPDDLTPP